MTVNKFFQKLKPFFPPLAPLQSLNLRAALFRCLNELKKTGVLGKDVTIRKTMLDECRGNKFEEVLVSFSTVVLHKCLAAEKDGRPAISRSFSFATKLRQSDQKSLLPLAIAHRASLSALLRRKEQLRGRYTVFQDVLSGRRDRLDQRKASLDSDENTKIRTEVGRQDIENAMKQIGLYWNGGTKWLEVVVEGDAKVAHDPLLDTPFEIMWKKVRGGSTASRSGAEFKGLLQDLENRIASQEARLRKWQQFRTKFTKGSSEFAASNVRSASTEPTASIGISFGAHKDLVVDPRKTQELESLHDPDVFETHKIIEYERLIKSLEHELRDVDEPKKQGHRPGQKTVLIPGPLSQLTPHLGDAVRIERFSEQEVKKSTKQAEKADIQDPIGGKYPSERSEGSRNPKTLSSFDKGLRTPKPNEPPRMTKSQSSPTGQSYSSRFMIDTNSKAIDTPDTEYDEDELLAAEIVSLTMNAGPSPIKSQRSLAERTRQSLAYTSSHHHPLPDAPSMQPPPSRAPRPSMLIKPPDVKATLLERTRQSMSILPTEPRKSVHKQQPSKQFPTNQFETPKKEPARPRETEKNTPPEKLFRGDAEYASVFKSRPRIAMSPTPSPSPGEDPSSDDNKSGTIGRLQSEQWDSSP